MILIFAWIIIVGFEILRNYLIIEAEEQRPVYWKSTVLRIAVGFAFWIGGPFMDSRLTWWQWWGMIPMMLLTFWFVFDYGLNLARQKAPFYYLNPEGSFLDKLQCNYPNTYTWFWWKLMLMAVGIDLFIEGINVTWERI